MALTNRFNLPAPIVRAIANDKYSRGDADFSVTQLIGPPQIRHLLATNEPIEDASDKLASLLGQAMHSIIERACEGYTNLLSEKRLYMNVLDKRISGAFDIYDIEKRTLFDLKVTSTYAADGKIEWERQLNMLILLLRFAGFRVDKAVIIPIFRDWMGAKARTDSSYPQAAIVPIDINIWSHDQQLEYAKERVRVHSAPVPAPCTPEERWAQPGVFAVMKPGRKSSLRNLDTKAQAVKWLEEDGTKGCTIVERPTTYRRCESYCSVSTFCPQLKAESIEAPF
jgi:hypothetical protein